MPDTQKKRTNDRVGVGVAVIITREGDAGPAVLLVRRKYHGHGTWSPPGGYIVRGELLEESCIREVREETGLEIIAPEFLCLTNDIHEDGKHNVTLWFTAEAISPEQPLRISPESLDAEWFPWDRLPVERYWSLENFLSGPTYPPDRGGYRLPNEDTGEEIDHEDPSQ
jgi:ADP-ribose pyrophosphatase YjhB (NUDIX family)